jgi:hypothetical protein
MIAISQKKRSLVMMNKPLHTLYRQLFPSPSPLDTPAFCTACREKLPLFVTDELTGEKVDHLYPDVAFHLDVCLACQDEYESLALLLSAALFEEEPT